VAHETTFLGGEEGSYLVLPEVVTAGAPWKGRPAIDFGCTGSRGSRLSGVAPLVARVPGGTAGSYRRALERATPAPHRPGPDEERPVARKMCGEPPAQAIRHRRRDRGGSSVRGRRQRLIRRHIVPMRRRQSRRRRRRMGPHTPGSVPRSRLRTADRRRPDIPAPAPWSSAGSGRPALRRG
jgi:hypothetical protein